MNIYSCNHFNEESSVLHEDTSLRKWDEGVPSYYFIPEWTDTDFECPEPNCGGVMQRNNMYVLTSNPPKYEYKCKKCGSIHYRFE